MCKKNKKCKKTKVYKVGPVGLGWIDGISPGWVGGGKEQLIPREGRGKSNVGERKNWAVQKNMQKYKKV